MTSKPPNGHIIDIKSSTGRSSIVVFFSPLSAKSYLQSTTVCVVPLAGIISCRLAFASLSHVVGWVWTHALRRDYSRRGIEGLWGIWQLSSHINSSPPPPLVYFFFVGCLFVYLDVWWDVDTCLACLIGIVGVWSGRWGPSGLRRHQDGAIQVATSVTLRLGPWSVSTSLHSLDALAELLNSWGLLALSTYLLPGLFLLTVLLGWRGSDSY